jgi:hypothetical protein
MALTVGAVCQVCKILAEVRYGVTSTDFKISGWPKLEQCNALPDKNRYQMLARRALDGSRI